MSEGPDYLTAALHFALRAGRFLNDGERDAVFCSRSSVSNARHRRG